ncbi:ribonuclease H-like domain-containing protein [Tanacetum coccineum]
MTANTNSIRPYLNNTSGNAVAFHTGLAVVAGPPAGLISPLGHEPLPAGLAQSTQQPGDMRPAQVSGQATTLSHAFTIETLRDFSNGAWNMDTGASSHLNNSVNSLSENFNTCMYPSISVGDGHYIPVTNTGHSILPTPLKPLRLNNVLITPHIVKNLIYVRQFICHNNCTIEFDVFGFSVKDFMTRRVLLRCDSTGDLYPVTTPSLIPHVFFVSQHTWHQRLGHPGGEVLRRLVSSNFILCNKEKPLVLCHACQLGKHYLVDGTLSRYKARLVVNGSTQLEGVNVDDTFNLIVKPCTIRTVLSLDASRHWPIRQLDVKNALLHGNSQVKDNKIDLLVQQHEQFVISEDESIDSVFARFNTIITSLKALDEGYSSKNYVRKFLRALHPKWRAKVMVIGRSKGDLTVRKNLVIESVDFGSGRREYAMRDENSSIDELALDNEYDKLCKMSLKIIIKNKGLKATRNSLENELRELKDKLSTLEKNKGVDLDCAKCHALKIENEKLKEESTRLNKFEKKPKNVNEALGDESWIVAMQEELNQFIANDVWELVPQPRNMTIIGTKWVFRNKLDENGVVSRNKARLVVQGYNQQEGIDYDETYVPVAKLESIRILLAYACALDFKLFQMDVKSAFLNGFINEEFEMSMMGELNFFLGLQIKQMEDGIFFNQSKYIKGMLKKFGLKDSKPMKTPMSSDTKLTKDKEYESVDSTKYQGMIGACVFTDRWRLDELAYGIPSDGPYQLNPPSIEDIISSIRIDREGQVRRIRHGEEIDVLEYQILTRVNFEAFRGNHLGKRLLSGGFNLAYYMAKRMEWVTKQARLILPYDHVMNPLAAQLERKPRRACSTRRGRPSTSSSTFDQPSSSHLNDDDGNDKGTSRASTPSPIRYVNSLTNQVP